MVGNDLPLLLSGMMSFCNLWLDRRPKDWEGRSPDSASPPQKFIGLLVCSELSQEPFPGRNDVDDSQRILDIFFTVARDDGHISAAR